MIVYTPLWKTMKQKNLTVFDLCNEYDICECIIQRLCKNESVSTNILEMLCKILECTLDDIAEFIPDEEAEEKNK